MYTSRNPCDNFKSLGFGDRVLHFNSRLLFFSDSHFEGVPLEGVPAGTDELVEDSTFVHSVGDTSFGAMTSSDFSSALVVETITSVRAC
jgi:hypothetical protein